MATWHLPSSSRLRRLGGVAIALVAIWLSLAGAPIGPGSPAEAQAPFAPFAGPWTRTLGSGYEGTSLTLTVARDGTGMIDFSVRRLCDDTTRPACPEGGPPTSIEVFAGHVLIAFSEVRQSTAYGQVIDTDNPNLLAVGEHVWLTVVPGDVALLTRLKLTRQEAWYFCGMNAGPGRNAPPGFTENLPCGGS